MYPSKGKRGGKTHIDILQNSVIINERNTNRKRCTRVGIEKEEDRKTIHKNKREHNLKNLMIFDALHISD